MRALRLSLTLALLTAVPAAASTTVRTLEQDLPVQGASAVQIKVPVGDLQVRPGDGDAVSVRMEIRCPHLGSRCRSAAEEIALKVRRHDRWLKLQVEGFPRVGGHSLSTDVELTLPRALAFQADLGVGEVEIRGLTNDVEVDVGVGDVEITMAAVSVRSVELDAGVGDVDLYTAGRRLDGSGLVGHHLDWDGGEGAAHVEVDCGVGDIEVELEE